MVDRNTQPRHVGTQKVENGHKRSDMVGEISPKFMHDVGIHGGTRMVADGLRWVRMSVAGRIGS